MRLDEAPGVGPVLARRGATVADPKSFRSGATSRPGSVCAEAHSAEAEQAVISATSDRYLRGYSWPAASVIRTPRSMASNMRPGHALLEAADEVAA